MFTAWYILNSDINIVTLEYKPITKRLELIVIYLFIFIYLIPITKLTKIKAHSRIMKLNSVIMSPIV